MGARVDVFPCYECPVPEQAAQVEGVDCVGPHRIERTETILSLGAIGELVKVEPQGYRCPWVGADAPGNFVPIAGKANVIEGA